MKKITLAESNRYKCNNLLGNFFLSNALVRIFALSLVELWIKYFPNHYRKKKTWRNC